MADIAPLILSYPDFILGQMIDPEEFDQNNTEIVNKVNETVDVVNLHTEEITVADEKADEAIATANSAETKADNAVTTATTLGNEAKTIATNLGNEAKATAGSAETKADNAVTTANTALGQDVVEPYTGALGAMKIATDIKTDYDLLRPEIVQAVSDAEAAVTSIVDKVSTEQLNNAIIDVKNAIINEIDRKEPVATYDDLYTTYPNAEDGWLCMVRASRNMYMYNSALGEWELRPTEITYADEIGTDGIVTSEKFVEWNNKADLDENGNVPLEQLGNVDISDAIDDLAGVGRTTETVKGNADNHAAHLADYASKFPDNAGAHNSIYRGKYLGSSVTTEQYAAILDGTFKDLYIGDYWTIDGVNYRIAAFDYYYNTGDTAYTSHHVVIVPDTQLYAHVMNDTNITTGGYIGSKMYLEGLEQAKTKIKADFSGHVVNHRKYLCNAVTDGIASGGAWFDSEVELMNEVMVYGTIVNGHATYGLFNIGTEKTQLPLFALNPRMVNTRQSYWLRDVSSASYFAFVSDNGVAHAHHASRASGVRPAFSIS